MNSQRRSQYAIHHDEGESDARKSVLGPKRRRRETCDARSAANPGDLSGVHFGGVRNCKFGRRRGRNFCRPPTQVNLCIHLLQGRVQFPSNADGRSRRSAAQSTQNGRCRRWRSRCAAARYSKTQNGRSRGQRRRRLRGRPQLAEGDNGVSRGRPRLPRGGWRHGQLDQCDRPELAKQRRCDALPQHVFSACDRRHPTLGR